MQVGESSEDTARVREEFVRQMENAVKAAAPFAYMAMGEIHIDCEVPLSLILECVAIC